MGGQCQTRLRLTTAIDALIAVGAIVDVVDARVGQPVWYSPASPVMSPFTACMSQPQFLSIARLFLWQFLASGWANRLVFALLFANQFVAPLVVALVLTRPGAAGPVWNCS